jgi:hypothetical protein
MDLENRNAALQDELSQGPARRTASQSDWFPRAPAAHVLTGHRQPVTRVAFHPQYSILASSSEDTTVKIWDWETGELERTLKGHTKAVTDLDFDHKGNLLGESRVRIMTDNPNSGSPSDLFFRRFYQDMGLAERLEKHKDVSRTRTFGLCCAIHARRSIHRQRKPRQDDQNFQRRYHVRPLGFSLFS